MVAMRTKCTRNVIPTVIHLSLMRRGALGQCFLLPEYLPHCTTQHSTERECNYSSRKLVWMVVFSPPSFMIISHNHTNQKQISNLKSSRYAVASPSCSVMVTLKTAFSYLFHKRIKTVLTDKNNPAR
jgi:hypothetical protein